ncbi:MAG: nucleoside-diphosphate kinase [Candidatus Aenigmarchaeota archaeon]|nr:nucleoside-diphosphate kinase [Candidatus Aenigmarchaeota archaeon]
MTSEREFVIIKPDAVQRGLIGEIISRFERKGLKFIAMKLLKLDRKRAEALYAVHKGKPFYEELLVYITSGPIVVFVVEGQNAIKIVRTLVGATNPLEAALGTIRGDFALSIRKNAVHASDSPENAAIERSIFFDEEEILSYERIDEIWLYE